MGRRRRCPRLGRGMSEDWRLEQIGRGVDRCPTDHENELAQLEFRVTAAVEAIRTRLERHLSVVYEQDISF